MSDSLSIALLGPASPRDMAHLFGPGDAPRAASLAGYRGTPVSGLAEVLLASGHTVEVLTTAADTTIPQDFEGPGLRMRVVPMRPRARDRALDHFAHERAGLKALLAESQADVLHAHWTYEFALAALSTKRPTVVTAHDAPMTVLRRLPDPYRLIRASMAWRVRARIRRLVVVSPYLERQWRRQMLFRGEIQVVPNAASLPSAEGSADTMSSPRHIVTIGDSSKLKNIATLLRAFALMRAHRADLRLDVIGPGLAIGDALPRWASEQGLDGAVEFHGRVERQDLMRLLADASVLAHPSLEECQPMAVLEAMSLGVPVVGGIRAGGLPWTLGDGRAGALVDVTDPAALAKGIRRLLDDPGLRTRIASAAMTRLTTEFAPASVAERYEAEYERAMALGPA